MVQYRQMHFRVFRSFSNRKKCDWVLLKLKNQSLHFLWMKADWAHPRRKFKQNNMPVNPMRDKGIRLTYPTLKPLFPNNPFSIKPRLCSRENFGFSEVKFRLKVEVVRGNFSIEIKTKVYVLDAFSELFWNVYNL